MHNTMFKFWLLLSCAIWNTLQANWLRHAHPPPPPLRGRRLPEFIDGHVHRGGGGNMLAVPRRQAFPPIKHVNACKFQSCLAHASPVSSTAILTTVTTAMCLRT